MRRHSGHGLAGFGEAAGVRLLVLLAVLLSGLAGCSRKSPTQAAADTPHNITLTQEQQQSLHIITVAPSSYHTTLTTNGIVDFDHDQAADVVAPFSGAVTRVLVSQGQQVTKGQALALVASPDFAAAAGGYRKTLLAARAANGVAQNDRALYQQHAISERENAQAQADAASANADRDAALQTLEALHVDPQTLAKIRAGKPVASGQGVIRAPIAGMVVAKSIAPAQTLVAGTTPCFTLADTRNVWVMAQLFGTDVAQVRVGDSATVDDGNGGVSLIGKVTNVGEQVDPDTGAVAARVAVDNPQGALKKQMYVSVTIQSQDARQGLLLPVSAVLRNDENLPFVYVEVAAGGYARQPVTLGLRVGDDYVISEGLHAGDKVVVDGSIFLRFIETQ